MNRQLSAVALSLVLLASVAGPATATVTATTAGNLSVDVTQADDVTITVTDGSTGAANATVEVTVDDENGTYAEAGTHTTGENGTVSLWAPEETVNVTVTATVDNATATTTATLTAAGENYDNFGQELSAFVQQSLSDGTEGPLGQAVSSYALANNPSDSIPDHARNKSGNETTGPPDHAGPGNQTGNETGNQSGGPPDHAGPPDEDDDDGNNGNGNGGDNGNQAGNGEKKGNGNE